MPGFTACLLRRITPACGALALGACTTLGPDYQEPEVAWLSDWQPSAYLRAATREARHEADLRFWWRRFNDPALNLLIEAAKQDNLPLRIAGLRILESRALLGIAGSGHYPQVQQATGALSYVNTRQRGGDLPEVSQGLISYQLGFNVGWELDFWGRFQRGIESADAAFFASIANQRDLQVLISARVTDLYFVYRTTEARIAIARENAAIQKRSYEITRRLFNSGGDSELDLQQAKTQYLATLATIPQLESALTNTRNALCALLGRAPGDLPELAGTGYRLPDVNSAGIQAVPASLLTRRPDVRAAAWQVAAQSAQIGIAEADYYPAISLSGTVGWSGSSLGGSPAVGNLAVGPSVRWNIFDYGRIENNVRLQDARLQQLIEQYQETVLQAAREIDDAAIGVVKTAEQQALLDRSVDAARRALEIANTRYREGYSDFQRVLDAQRSLFGQMERRLINQGSHFGSVVALYKGLGGGWEQTPAERLIPEEVRRSMQGRSDWGNLLTAPLPDSRTNPTTAPGASRNE